MTALDMALALRRRGLSVIPVPRPRPGVPAGTPGDGKVPAIAWRQFQDRLPTDDEITQWFAAPMNIAVISGAISGIVIIDADSPDALRWCTRHLPYTPWQTKTARGFHLWYKHPGGRIQNRAYLETRDGRLAIDVRGDGGYVIAPGSIHATGHVYEFAGDWSVPRDRLPAFWVGWLRRPERVSQRRPFQRPTGDLVERGRRYLAVISPPQIGQGSDHATFYAACRLLRGFGLDASTVAALLWEWAGGRPGWTREWIADKVDGAEKYGTEPIGALR